MPGSDFAAGAGSVNIDLLYYGIDSLPVEGEEVYSKNLSVQLGGGIPATLINAGRLGVPARIATELGEDMFSEFAKGEFIKNRVEPINVYKGNGGNFPLNITSAMITERDRTFISYGCGSITADDRTLEEIYGILKGAKIVLMDNGNLFPVYEKLKKEGSILLFDCGWDSGMSLEKYEKQLALADYFMPNQKEAKAITKTDSPYKALEILSRYIEKPVVKLDKAGCIGLENGRIVTVPQIDEYRCVDSTGAGDAFLSGFVYGLFYGYSFADCLLFGNITGGKCVTEVGCLAAKISENELKTMYSKYRRNIQYSEA